MYIASPYIRAYIFKSMKNISKKLLTKFIVSLGEMLWVFWIDPEICVRL